MCWKSQSLQTLASFEKVFCIRVLVLELPTQWFKALSFVDFAMLTRDYRECSRYSRSSVGTPELKMSNTFIDALNVCRKPVDRLQSEFLECSEDSL